MTLERTLEHVQVPVPVDLSEVALGLEHAGGDPPKGHLPLPPPLHVPGDVAGDPDHRLDRVRRLQRAKERVWKPETGEGERFLQAFCDRGGRAGMGRLQVSRDASQFSLGRGGVRVLPGGADLAAMKVRSRSGR
jgi:hypothetical protein